ncbi:MAG: polynucleotide adenylyltransferase PcnB [Rubrivivax sp.]|jgi:poly(A) polymerase|nr:polynucleotide adenylyltransferase PcnB [Rubrivivax sp.]
MIKRFINRLLGKGPAGDETPPAAAPVAVPVVVPLPAAPVLGVRKEYTQAEHGIKADLLDDNAVRVVRTLREAGYEAYVVGGAVRDLLVGRRPKDFDVATDATPEQVKGLFRRAFIIGRRFRIVHVVFGRGREHEVIEVSTFRALLDADAAEQVAGNEKTSKAALAGKAHAVDASGRVLRDNVWGPQVEDAARRDFSVNAMYYEPLTQTLVDYHGGLADVRAKVLRIIGDPPSRYREDPVRILRAVRFAAKLGFQLDPDSRKPVREMAPLLANIPVSRLFDELIKLLQTGHALASLEELQRQGLGRGIFPILDAALADMTEGSPREAFVKLALRNTDERVAEGKPVAPSFLLACLLWHEVQHRWLAVQAQGESPFPALQQAIDAVFEARVGDISGRGKLAADMREIWQMQPRFERRSPASALGVVEQPRFRAGYDFLRLRGDVGEVPAELPDWWEDLSLGSDEEREAMLQDLRASQVRRVPGRSKDKAAKDAPAVPAASRSAAAGASGAASGAASRAEPDDGAAVQLELDIDLSDAPSADDGPPRKRRRRRRGGQRGAAGGAGAAGSDTPTSDGAGSGRAPSDT